MKKAAIIFFTALFPAVAMAEKPEFTLKIHGIENNQPIPAKFAFCQPDGKGKTMDGGNINPEISWEHAPAGTKSFALIVADPDVPATFDDANKEGKTIPENFPRQDFYHWVLVDIPANINKLEEGVDSKAVVKTGKVFGKTAYGVNGQNDYAKFMKGTFGGYDGPCPPWNDARIHHYNFTIYALDTETLGLNGNFNGKEAMTVIEKHTIGKAQIIGTYTDRP